MRSLRSFLKHGVLEIHTRQVRHERGKAQRHLANAATKIKQVFLARQGNNLRSTLEEALQVRVPEITVADRFGPHRQPCF